MIVNFACPKSKNVEKHACLINSHWNGIPNGFQAATQQYKQIVREVFPDYTGEYILGASAPFRILGRGGEALHISEVLLRDICAILLNP